MHDFRKNLTENITANILWQYVSSKMNDVDYYKSMANNVIIFDAKYKFYNTNRHTEILVVINNNAIRIDCKRLSKGSNFTRSISFDIEMLEHTQEENILFVCQGEGFENNKDFEALKMSVKEKKESGYTTKNIQFVMLNELDSYIQNTYKVQPNWEKQAYLKLQEI